MPLTRDQEKKNQIHPVHTHNKTITFYQIKYTVYVKYIDYTCLSAETDVNKTNGMSFAEP